METTDPRRAGNLVFITLALVPILTTLLIFYFAWNDLSQTEQIKRAEVTVGERVIRNLTRPATVNFNLPELSARTVKMLFFGDLMLDRHVGEKINQGGLDNLLSGLSGTSSDLFVGFDLVGANLEGAVTDNGAHYPPLMSYDFSFHPDLIGGLKKYNFNFFNIANNHLSDQGERGVTETAANLKKLNYAHSGCVDRKTGECSSAIVTLNGKKIGLAGFSMVYGLLDEAEAEKITKELSAITDSVIINIHWGREYEHDFSVTQESLARKLIDAGADAIIGHHPHVVQGMEIYKEKPIFYSLGNFIFDQYFSPDTQEGLGVGLELSDHETAITLFPLRSKLSRPKLMEGDEKVAFLEKFVKWSEVDLDIAEQIKSGHLVFGF